MNKYIYITVAILTVLALIIPVSFFKGMVLGIYISLGLGIYADRKLGDNYEQY